MKSCPEDKILNPITNRCVKKDGAIGKKLVDAVQQPTTTKKKKQADEDQDILSVQTSPIKKQKLKKKKQADEDEDILSVQTSPIKKKKQADEVVQQDQKTMTRIRVREALSNSVLRGKLIHKIPKNAMKKPELNQQTVNPNELRKHLPNTYSDLGIMTEYLLRTDVHNIETQLLQRFPASVVQHPSTQKYIAAVNQTRTLLHAQEPFKYDQELSQPDCPVIGHPDILSDTTIYEVKTTNNLVMSWSYFLLQSFCYAALAPSHYKTLCIVLPLQATLWTYDLSKWKSKDAFLQILREFKVTESTQIQKGVNLIMGHRVGRHIGKKKTLTESLDPLIHIIKHVNVPLQMFLGMKSSPTATKDTDVKNVAKMIQDNRMHVYAHAPYIFNICNTDDWIVEGLVKHLNLAAQSGFMGVVVHVGKRKTTTMTEALLNMKNNILTIMEKASQNAIFILETPAGQGTEVLTDCESFMNWVTALNHPRVKTCIDTCHVWSCGHLPDDYLQKTLDNPVWKQKLALIHYNDSETDLGSHVDRHAVIGRGKIPLEHLRHCAQIANKERIDLVGEW